LVIPVANLRAGPPAEDDSVIKSATRPIDPVERFAQLFGTTAQRIAGEGEAPELWTVDVTNLGYLWKPLTKAMGTTSRGGEAAVEFQPGTPGSRPDDLRWLIEFTPAKAAGITLSVGAVWWSLRAGGLLASLAASMPVWRGIDVTLIIDDRKIKADGAQAEPPGDPE